MTLVIHAVAPGTTLVLVCTFVRIPTFAKSGRMWATLGRVVADELAKFGDLGGELKGAGRSFAAPEGNGGRLAVGILDEDSSGAGLDATDAPTAVAEEHDVASVGLDGEVFVESSDNGLGGQGNYVEERALGNGSAGGDGSQARAATGTKTAVDLIAVEIGSKAPALGTDAFAEHDEDFIKGFAREVAVVAGTANKGEELVLIPLIGGTGGDDLLGEDVEGRVGKGEAIEVALTDGADDGGALDEFVTRGSKEAALGDGSTPVPGATYALHGDGDGAWRTNLADKVNIADVDAEFERSGGNKDAALTLLETALGLEAEMAGERTMMGSDLLLAHAPGKMVRDALDEAAGVDEDKSGAVLDGKLLKAIVDFVPHLVGGDGAEFGGWKLDGEIERAGGGDDDGDRRVRLRLNIDISRYIASGRNGDGWENRLLVEKLGEVWEI
jgi:hypothetical protein